MIRNIVSVSTLIVLAAVSFIFIGHQGVSWFANREDRTHVTLIVPDAAGLIPRSPVLLRGIRIGEVESLSSSASDVSLRLWYHGDVMLPVESIYRVENLSALGETYLSISPQQKHGPFLENDQTVVANPDVVGGSIGEMAVAVTRFLEDLEPERFNRIVNELDSALLDTSAVPELAAFSRRVNETVSGSRATIEEILVGVQALLSNAQSVVPALAEIPEPLLKMSRSFADTLAAAVVLVYYTPELSLPDDLQNGSLTILNRLIEFEDDIALNLYNLTAPLLPAIQATAGALSGLDASRLLDATMSSLRTPGAFTVHVIPSR